uniref:Plethodontid modulating factor n=1 Tax=Plethodon shermani TaxID=263671 RepID=Q0GB01_9SALA|nr:plethodontid modulating factor [Plethodon shermani]
MRTTALLILLVVLVSTGEALKCNTLNGGIVQCSGNGQACVHFKDKEDEFKRCCPLEHCMDKEGDKPRPEMVRCCTQDLCN